MEERSSQVFKVFIGSPGDVAALRKVAFDMVKRLSDDAWRPSGLVVEGYGWDVTHYPKLANVPPQANIEKSLPNMAEYDLCLFIIGSRLGSPLDDENFAALPDGRQPTGTEYEYNSAVAEGGQPAVLVYYHEKPLSIDPKASVEDQQEALSQYQRAQSFVKQISQNESGHYIGGLFTFASEDPFTTQLEKDLKRLVKDLMPPATGGSLPTVQPTAPGNVPEAYLHWLKKDLPDLSLKGMHSKVTSPVRLPDIYVPALVMTTAVEDEEITGTGLQGAVKRSNLELLLSRLDRESQYVSGAPGSGKTTFSFWLCWLLTEGQLIAHPIEEPEEYREELPTDLMGRLPLLCRLRDFWGHMDCRRDNGNWTKHQLEQGLARWLDSKGPDGLTGQDLLDWLAQGRCLLIFDGFDEVPERHRTPDGISYPRETLLSGLEHALPDWQLVGNRVLLTSRPYGLSDAERRRLGLDESPLQPLPTELQQLFIRRWYATTHGGEDSELADTLWQHLQARDEPWLDELTANPLLLTALCVKFSEGQVLPTDQYELFDAVVENTLYSRFRDATREILPVRRRLEAVAWGMQSGEVLDMEPTCPVAEIRLDQVDTLLAHHAGQNPLSEAGGTTAAQRRDELLTRSGLLLPHGSDHASFYHLMFQDFFAAEQVLRNPAASIAGLLNGHAADPRWHSLFIFLLSGQNRRGNGIDGPLNTFGAVLRPALQPTALGSQALPAILWGRCLELAHTQVPDLGELGEEFFAACTAALQLVDNPKERSRLFDALARLGLDRRPGVGLGPDGLPDIDWVEIPAGEFIYGEGDKQETLQLDAFSISRYPITNGQYQAFIDDGGYADARWWQGIEQQTPTDPAWREGNRPRETVSWYEAMAFCRWLSDGLDMTVSLPTEQQWEKAARGSDGRTYPWGDDYVQGTANVDEKERDNGPNYLQQTTAVGLYPAGASPAGVMDMAGNAWEWCLTKYDRSAAVQPDDSGDPRVLRGGSWGHGPEGARSAGCLGDDPGIRGPVIGFRVLFSGPLAGH